MPYQAPWFGDFILGLGSHDHRVFVPQERGDGISLQVGFGNFGAHQLGQGATSRRPLDSEIDNSKSTLKCKGFKQTGACHASRLQKPRDPAEAKMKPWPKKRQRPPWLKPHLQQNLSLTINVVFEP